MEGFACLFVCLSARLLLGLVWFRPTQRGRVRAKKGIAGSAEQGRPARQACTQHKHMGGRRLWHICGLKEGSLKDKFGNHFSTPT